MLQFLVTFRVVRQRFKLRYQIQHRLSTVVDVFIDRLRRVQHEILRQIADHEIASPRDVANVGMLHGREKFQERCLAAAVASDQPDAVALLNRERGGIKHGAIAVADGDVCGGDDGGHVRKDG